MLRSLAFMPRRVPKWLVVVGAGALAAAGVVAGAHAADEKKTEARRLYDEATAAFGVGNYAEAAEKYEGSFKLHPDAALLYNAAQAYRMSGNPGRALQLYRNFLRIYADNPRAEDARNHVAALEKANAGSRDASPAPTPGPPPPAPPAAPATAPAPVTGPPTADLAAAGPISAPPPTLIGTQAPASTAGEQTPSLVTRPWFWIAVGVAVAGATAAVLFATRSDTYPNPTLGKLP
jgi:tetratricopeptide (TPR) repeat protein